MDTVHTRMEHCVQTLQYLQEYRNISQSMVINGKTLTIPQLYHVYRNDKTCVVEIEQKSKELMSENAEFLDKLIQEGCIIYGVNTGYGGSADVRCDNTIEVQKSLIRHLNAGFGDTLPCSLVRAVMVVRSNSLCIGYSGVHPSVPQMMVDMVNKDVIPIVPKRGSVSASGDLMPTSYIASAMMASDNSKVEVQGQTMDASSALKSAGLEPIVFKAKEALAVVNAASFASTLGGCVLYDANKAAVLTQICTALSVECLRGRVESFHPLIHQCMPHPGQQEVAKNIKLLLNKSKFAIQELDMKRKDKPGCLKQDRYALRSAPQWLGPVVETLLESMRRITTEINSVNDNPLIDHKNENVLHGANFQGTSITIAMDQARQSIQLCGKLLFAQMQEIVNVSMNNGLPPNLCGSDISADFGFKGMDTAMASYMSELDFLTNNMSNHVLSAELHNQAVNSMGLVSARLTQQALELLQMMIVNILCAQMQAIDLRWLKFEIELILDTLYKKNHLSVNDIVKAAFPWYNFAFDPSATAKALLGSIPTNGFDAELLVKELDRGVGRVMHKIKANRHTTEVESRLGKGTKKMYSFIRKKLVIPFYDGSFTLDVHLQKIFDAVQSNEVDAVLIDIVQCMCSK